MCRRPEQKTVQKILGKSSGDSLLLDDFFGPQLQESPGPLDLKPQKSLKKSLWGGGVRKEVPKIPGKCRLFLVKVG